MASNYKTPPAFSEKKPYNRWVDEVKAWIALTDLDVKKQGLAIALSLPEEDGSSIRDQVFSEISVDDLQKEDGVKTLIEFMDNIYKQDALSEAYEAYAEFDRYKRSNDASMDMYVGEFEKLYNRTKKYKMDLPESVLAFKLLESANLEKKDRQLVLTGVNYCESATLFKQMGNSLKKFFGKQAMASGDGAMASSRIKVEPAMIAEEEAYFTRPNTWSGNRKGNFGGKPWYNGRGRGQSDRWGGNNGGRRGFRGGRGGDSENGSAKKINPPGPDGNPLRCRSCDSIRHMIRECPDSYENMARKGMEKAVLFTGNHAQEMQVLVTEAINSAVLDSACSSTVAGEGWTKCYLDSLSPENAAQVIHSDSDTVFRFGGGRCLKSKEKITFPCMIAGVNCEVSTDVVESDIPLLLSKSSMKKAKMKLDLENDSASIFGKQVDLQCTSSGHYCVSLEQPPTPVDTAVDVLVSTIQKTPMEKRRVIDKLHKQFAHPTSHRLKALLRDAGVEDDEYYRHIEEVADDCQVCKQYKKTPARPVVGLPVATEFNEVVAMDLKEWKKGVYFLHLIDMATRFSLAAVIHRKTPATIIEKIMKVWIGSGLGPPKRFLADNGGEFANADYRDMAENLNIQVWNTAGLSPWQNGLCERNHAVVDDCVAKILEDDPQLDLEVALLWAVNAKNSLQMVSGWSPYQLVFGINPNLPSVLTDKPPALEGTTMNEIFAKHLNALHSGRRAFIQAESSQRIRRALRHQIRSAGEHFEQGESVYYKRDDSHKWKGPGKVIGQDGKVVFVRHGNIYVRVHPCRLVKVGHEFQKNAIDLTNGDDKPVEIKRTDDPVGKEHMDEDDVDVRLNSTRPEQNENANGPPELSLEIDNSNADNQSGNFENTIAIRNTRDLPRVGQQIMYLPTGQDKWKKSKIISKGGKATGKNWAYMNVQDQDDEKPKGLNFDSDVAEWKPFEDLKIADTNQVCDVNVTLVPQNRHEDEAIRVAKDAELENWKRFSVYEEVADCGQSCISTRWVITEKIKQEKVVVKARLVARGFEAIEEVQADSPTAGKDVMRIFLALASTMSWKCMTIDVKAAFLQGQPIERDIYLKPPKEVSQPNILWKLKKCVYGLSDASRNWYFSVRNKLLKNGCVQSKTDLALFFWYDEEKIAGIFIMHVDDFLWAGTPNFKRLVIDHIRNAFQIGKEAEGQFTYVGMEIQHREDCIILHQQSYIDSLQGIPVSVMRASGKQNMLTQGEITQLREVIGQTNWVTTQTRPDINFDVLELSMTTKHPKVENLIQANKLIKNLKAESYHMVYPKLGDLQKTRLVLFTDASYANLSDGVSSAGGHIVFLVGENGNCCPISWSAKKIRRVVKSTIAAETLALVDGLDVACYIKGILTEILFPKGEGNMMPIDCYIDNKSLFESVHSTKAVSEKRLRIDIASIKEMIQKEEISSVKWIETNLQLADSLTKRGASGKKLIEVLKTGQLLVA